MQPLKEVICVLAKGGVKMNVEELNRRNMSANDENREPGILVIETLQTHSLRDRAHKIADLTKCGQIKTRKGFQMQR